jgi:PIN domain nuclease of toxin-antitoxin system
MPALLDTHAFLWLASDEGRLSRNALEYVKDTSNRLFLSIASSWEIALKVGRGRLQIDVPLLELLTDVPQRLSVDVLPIQASHLIAVASLPEHHRDPFDRLLVAQSLVEGLPIVSVDGALDAYGVTRIW